MKFPFRFVIYICERESSSPLSAPPPPETPQPLRLIFTSERAHEKLMMWETLVSLIMWSLAQKQMSSSEPP